MSTELSVSIFDLVLCLSQAVDSVSPLVADHHKRVAYIAFRLAEELGLPVPERKELAMAGALHDVGGLSLKDRIDALRFEVEKPHEHAEVSYLLLKTFQPLLAVATVVRFHHVRWDHGAGSVFNGERVPMASHLLHLADRVSVLIKPEAEVLAQVEAIRERIEQQSGEMFVPQFVDAFKSLAAMEYFWLDIVSRSLEIDLSRAGGWEDVELGERDFLDLTNLFRRIIDFKSPFTAAHSSGVAACAEALASWAGFSEQECRMMRMAGYLHDLGKLSVPTEVLEKPAKLIREESYAIRRHTYYTDRILEPLGVLDVIRSWSALHHERLDGTGYPFHLKGEEISLGSRIMAVADVFVALTEDRPYRKGMTREEALEVIERMASDSALDEDVVSLIRLHFDEVNAVRVAAQDAAAEEYRKFQKEVHQLLV